jgi:hypothetical protein
MLKHCFLALALLCLTHVLHAQSDSARFEFGPSILAGASTFAGNAPGEIESTPEATYGLGVMNVIQWTSDNFGMVLGIAFESRAYSFSPQDYAYAQQTVRMNYVSVQAGMKIGYVLFTTVVGIPISGRETFNPGSWFETTEQHPDPSPVQSRRVNITEEDIMLDLRLGLLVPILAVGTNHLSAQAQVSWGLSRMRFVPTALPEKRGSVVSIQAGLSYFFAIR